MNKLPPKINQDYAAPAPPKQVKRVKRLQISLPLLLAVAAGLVVTAVIIVIALIATAPEPPAKQPVVFRPTVEVKIAETGSHRLAVKTQGQVLAGTQTNLVAEVSGRLIEVSPAMEEGGAFKKGDLLFRIDPRDYEAAFSAAKAELARSEANLTREQAEAEQARRDWETLGNGGEPSDLVLRKPQLAQSLATLESARAAVQKAETDLERTRITAPYDGRSLRKDAEIGGYVNNFSGQLGTIISTNYAEIRLPLSDRQLAKLDSALLTAEQGMIGDGPEVLLSTRVGAELRQWKGRITRMEAVVDATSRLYYAVARVDRPYSTEVHESPLMIGLLVDAEIEGREVNDMVEIPRAALHPNNIVHVIDDKNLLEKRPVQVLADLGDRIILSEGLQSGERICMTPLNSPMNGIEVTVANNGNDTAGNTAALPLTVANPEDTP